MTQPILVVDDDPGVRALVAAALDRVGIETREARSGSEALAAARRERPALVVLDVALPVVSGYEVCRQLREEFGQDLPIIFISGERVESYDRTGGIMLGADDYVVKPFDIDELLARIRRLVARATRRAPKGAYALTPRELEILLLLASGGGQTEIAARLVISEKTVATHIQRVLAKLGVRSRAQAVALAHQERLVDPADFAAHAV